MKGYAERIAGAIIRFGKDFEIFSSGSDYYDSVSMKLMQIGELCGVLSPEFKDATKDKLPWGAIRGLQSRDTELLMTCEWICPLSVCVQHTRRRTPYIQGVSRQF
jgi:hypothetical protein